MMLNAEVFVHLGFFTLQRLEIRSLCNVLHHLEVLKWKCGHFSSKEQ